MAIDIEKFRISSKSQRKFIHIGRSIMKVPERARLVRRSESTFGWAIRLNNLKKIVKNFYLFFKKKFSIEVEISTKSSLYWNVQLI